jgi:hypothetical protein
VASVPGPALSVPFPATGGPVRGHVGPARDELEASLRRLGLRLTDERLAAICRRSDDICNQVIDHTSEEYEQHAKYQASLVPSLTTRDVVSWGGAVFHRCATRFAPLNSAHCGKNALAGWPAGVRASTKQALLRVSAHPESATVTDERTSDGASFDASRQERIIRVNPAHRTLPVRPCVPAMSKLPLFHVAGSVR